MSSTSASTMSASVPSLCIAYALDRCTEQQVKDVFNFILDEDIVDNVKTLDKTNQTTGRPFKVFFINFKRLSDNLASIIARIGEDKFVRVEYEEPWFWKVTMARVKDEKPEQAKPVARIMGRDE